MKVLYKYEHLKSINTALYFYTHLSILTGTKLHRTAHIFSKINFTKSRIANIHV